MKKTVLLLASIFLIAGCSKNTKKTLGLVETMPDKYQVKRNKSLEIPPIYQLENSKAAKKTLNFQKQKKLC